jgi:NTP pyrophosphatase (non-canonical NTP hydrolase)
MMKDLTPGERIDICSIFELLARESWENAKRKGFVDSTPGEDIALMHSELSEALEEIRNRHPLPEIYYNPDKPDKPEGVPIELADIVIRVVQFCGRYDIDLANAILLKMVYNESRPFKHGGKTL